MVGTFNGHEDAGWRLAARATWYAWEPPPAEDPEEDPGSAHARRRTRKRRGRDAGYGARGGSAYVPPAVFSELRLQAQHEPRAKLLESAEHLEGQLDEALRAYCRDPGRSLSKPETMRSLQDRLHSVARVGL